MSLGPSCLSFLVPGLQNETHKDAIGIWKGAGVIIVHDAQKLGFLLGLLSVSVVVVVVAVVVADIASNLLLTQEVYNLFDQFS